MVKPSGKVWVNLLESPVGGSVGLRSSSTVQSLVFGVECFFWMAYTDQNCETNHFSLSLIPGVLLPVINTDQRI